MHAELTARLAMELGGSDGRRVDFRNLTIPSTPGLSALQRANEDVVRLCCVSEAFSAPVLVVAPTPSAPWRRSGPR